MSARKLLADLFWSLIELVAARDIRQAVLGDLVERYAAGARNEIRIPVREAVHTIAFLCVDRVRRSAWSRRIAIAMPVALTAVTVVLWETQVTKRQAWPVTAYLLDSSSLPAPALYLLVYLLLYLFGGALLLSASLSLRRHRLQQGKRIWPVLLPAALVLSLPPLFHMVQPEAFDRLSFRVLQLALMWAMVFVFYRLARGAARSSHDGPSDAQ
ncbi:MAG: hypothetical protein AAFX85_12310 [Pseudomonadota bacterium]